MTIATLASPSAAAALQPSTFMNKPLPLGTLFTRHGQPVSFSICVRKDQMKLVKLVQKHGGQVDDNLSSADIVIVDPTSSLIKQDNKNMCCADYIIQCIKERNLLPLDKYLMKPQEDEDDQASDASSRAQAPVASVPDSITTLREEEELLAMGPSQPFNATLFIHPTTKQPMSFTVARGVPDRQRIMQLIERHSGKVKEGGKVDYRIVDPMKSSDPQTLSYQFILDSTAFGRLKEVEPYLTGTLTRPKKRAQKVAFTHQDDIILIDFYLRSGESSYIKKFEELALLHPHHSAESWKNRFNKMADREQLIKQRRLALLNGKATPLNTPEAQALMDSHLFHSIKSLGTPLPPTQPSPPSQTPAIEPILLESTPSVQEAPQSTTVSPIRDAPLDSLPDSTDEVDVNEYIQEDALQQANQSPKSNFILHFEDVDSTLELPPTCHSIPRPCTPPHPQETFTTPSSASCVTPSLDRSIILSQSPTLTPVIPQKRKNIIRQMTHIVPLPGDESPKRPRLSPGPMDEFEEILDHQMEIQLGLPEAASQDTSLPMEEQGPCGVDEPMMVEVDPITNHPESSLVNASQTSTMAEDTPTEVTMKPSLNVSSEPLEQKDISETVDQPLDITFEPLNEDVPETVVESNLSSEAISENSRESSPKPVDPTSLSSEQVVESSDEHIAETIVVENVSRDAVSSNSRETSPKAISQTSSSIQVVSETLNQNVVEKTVEGTVSSKNVSSTSREASPKPTSQIDSSSKVVSGPLNQKAAEKADKGTVSSKNVSSTSREASPKPISQTSMSSKAVSERLTQNAAGNSDKGKGTVSSKNTSASSKESTPKPISQIRLSIQVGTEPTQNIAEKAVKRTVSSKNASSNSREATPKASSSSSKSSNTISKESSQSIPRGFTQITASNNVVSSKSKQSNSTTSVQTNVSSKNVSSSSAIPLPISQKSNQAKSTAPSQSVKGKSPAHKKVSPFTSKNQASTEIHLKAAKSVAALQKSQVAVKNVSKSVAPEKPSIPVQQIPEVFSQAPDYGEDMLDPFVGVSTLLSSDSSRKGKEPIYRSVDTSMTAQPTKPKKPSPKQDIASEINQLIRDFPRFTKKEIVKALDRVSGVPSRARKLIQANMDREAMKFVDQMYVFSKEEDVVALGTDVALLKDLKNRKGNRVVAERIAYLKAKQACKRRSMS